MLTAEAIDRVKRHWGRKGPAATVLAVVETLFSPLIRRRQRLVFEAQTNGLHQPSEWGPNESLSIFGPDNLNDLDRISLSFLPVARHGKDFQGMREGNRLFLVTEGNECVHQGYIRLINSERNDRKALFFGELETIPEIRSCVTAECARGKGLYRRVLNEQLRYLKALGYKRAVLYIMADNTASIKGATAAGFKLCRTLHDWIFFYIIVFQQVREAGGTRWRIFLQ